MKMILQTIMTQSMMVFN